MIINCDLDEEQAKRLKQSFIYQKNDDGSEIAEFDAFNLVGIDTILITSRHLYRQVYSINEKSGLVSIPINPHKVLAFDRRIAKVELKIVSKYKFLDREAAIAAPGEATELLVHAYDFVSEIKRDEEASQFQADMKKKEKAAQYADLTEKIPPEFFPPQITKMLGPLQDGKKRAMFILINFLRCTGYAPAEIEAMLRAWNEKHPEPIRETFFRGQLKSGLENPQIIPPQNYDPQVYTAITGLPIEPAEARMRNPVAYAKARYSTWIVENRKPVRGGKRKKPQTSDQTSDNHIKGQDKSEHTEPTKGKEE